MKHFSEEYLEKIQDRLEFLEYVMKFTIGTANAYGSNISQRHDAMSEATSYHNLVAEEAFRLRIEIAALEAFLDRASEE